LPAMLGPVRNNELLFEVPEGEVEDVRQMVVERMEGAVQLDVPVVVNAGVGRSWCDAKG